MDPVLLKAAFIFATAVGFLVINMSAKLHKRHTERNMIKLKIKR